MYDLMRNQNIVINGDEQAVTIFEKEGLVFNPDGSITIGHNLTNEFKGFYVSYNPLDIKGYGCTTTALVLGQMQRFYILKGNHMQEYKELIPKGFKACFDYYVSNLDKSHEISDKLPTIKKCVGV